MREGYKHGRLAKVDAKPPGEPLYISQEYGAASTDGGAEDPGSGGARYIAFRIRGWGKDVDPETNFEFQVGSGYVEGTFEPDENNPVVFCNFGEYGNAVWGSHALDTARIVWGFQKGKTADGTPIYYGCAPPSSMVIVAKLIAISGNGTTEPYRYDAYRRGDGREIKIASNLGQARPRPQSILSTTAAEAGYVCIGNQGFVELVEAWEVYDFNYGPIP